MRTKAGMRQATNLAGPGGPQPGSMAISGLDAHRVLELFDGNEKVFFEILRSYAMSTRQLLETLDRLLESENIEEYAIVIHGIKGASRGICAQKTGRAAELLELAAKAGDRAAVKSRHSAFVRIAKALLEAIDAALFIHDAGIQRPVAAKPDAALLRELRKACARFDMDGVDRVMARLESFRYERGNATIIWLREQINHMAFEKIIGSEWP